MKIKIKENKIIIFLLSVFLFAFTMNFIVHYIYFFYGHDSLLGFTRFFNFYEEANFPTWYSSLLLSLSSLLLLIISLCSEKDRKY
jgi:hypothetical protein